MIRVHWRRLRAESQGWNSTRCLYAYVDPRDQRILYIGKADGPTVRHRFRAAGKAVLEFLEWQLGVGVPVVLVGTILVEEGRRLSRELIADLESLLILRLKPRGNIQSIHSRIRRPGLEVECTGAWPHRRVRFTDRG